MSAAQFAEARLAYHSSLLTNVLGVNNEGVPSHADKHSKSSVRIALGIAQLLKSELKIKTNLENTKRTTANLIRLTRALVKSREFG